MAGKYPYTKEDVLGVDHLSAKQKQDIADDWNKNHLEAEAVRYSECRQAEYPSVGDQLDALYHAGVFPADMAAKLKKVKDDNPKG